MLHELVWNVTAGATALVAAGLFASLWRLERRRYISFWAVAWAILAAGVFAAGFAPNAAAEVLLAAGRLIFSAALFLGAIDALGEHAYRASRALILAADLVVLGSGLLLAPHGFAVTLSIAAALQIAGSGVLALYVRRQPSTTAMAVVAAGAAVAAVVVPVGLARWPLELFAYTFLAVTMFGVIFEEKREQSLATMKEVERLAFHDALTDLPNRLLFMDRAAVAFANAKRAGTGVAVVFVDLDRFKLVNDSFGHDVGDDVLRAVAGRLKETVREGDTVARLGGDEFTLLMPGIRHSGDVMIVASKLLQAFRAPMTIGARELLVTASIGISVYPEDAVDAETLIRGADAAMYEAKERGGDGYHIFTPLLHAYNDRQLELEGRLRLAVARNEFVLHYQPRVDAAMERVVAFEALLRWNDPERGLIMPGAFIQTAESSGLIVPMGQWVLRTACGQATQWHREGADVYVSVNLSPRQFHRYDLVATVSQALGESALESRFLELEIDETCVMNNADASMRILSDLKGIGVRVLISHFGAGYSSLRALRRFPIDGLKLDRSFSNGEDRSLATAALGLAKALNLKVIGEGVETREAAEFLRAQACDDIQGFLVSAAVPAEECTRFIARPAAH